MPSASILKLRPYTYENGLHFFLLVIHNDFEISEAYYVIHRLTSFPF